ncbi:hypothetical protein M436DRAFT_56144 [Aureobasidium namibiae CBS 147.97]|uniref:Uncharacterized protein n=1 Tax=Aureobasidium namibiae CBS 147.97 TaxID=1043004 RepID=A0A074X3N0_9PEZI|nr:uncharacterized protein M436DRAFT_56144 [Aureobasidium namibiae CBS 147.97]KEQ69216.1 hypothetical protein M436DRAFT_56144 [Aureobasidium namibiae CBS 147.97]
MQTINMSSYLDVLSWTRARKNREALEKTNPQNPVLNDDDEEFLQRITSQEAPAPPLPTIEPTVIDDEGNEKQADVSQKEAAEMILPASPGETSEKRTWASYIPNVGVPSVPAIPAMPSLASLRGRKGDAKVDEKEAAKPEDSEAKTESPAEEKNSYAQAAVQGSTQDDKNDLADQVAETAQAAKEPTLETAETAKETALETRDELTKDITTTSEPEANKEAEETPKDDTTIEKATDTKGKQPEEPTQRTWASYIPAVPTFTRSTKAQESAEAAAASQTPEAKEQDEREVSVLLDRLNLSAINNRVFSFSDQSQKLYAEFTLILKDIVNGAPTAWEDLETLLKENEKHLEQTFKNMPPFVQTLVKSLPSKFATSMGPELMAMAGDKPGNDLKKQMEAASTASSSISAQNINVDLKKKQKRKVPNIKDLAKQKGTVTSMLTNIVNFLKLRFPAFVTGTNVVMSLAVFILLFVFWYCRKRGKETRLLRESESAKHSADVSEIETSSSEDEAEDEKADLKTEEEPQSDEEEIKLANAKAYAAAMNRSAVGGPDNAAALRAKKILEG